MRATRQRSTQRDWNAGKWPVAKGAFGSTPGIDRVGQLPAEGV